MSDWKEMKGFLLIFGGVALFGGAVYCLVGFGTKCGRCEKWFADERIRREQVKIEDAAKDI